MIDEKYNNSLNVEGTNTNIFFCLFACSVKSQELEPRAYAALPKNLNAAVGVYALSHGNVFGDPSLPIQNLRITTNSFIGGYLRTFGLANKLARVQVTLPLFIVSGKATLNDKDTSVTRTGFGDMRIRLGINLVGAPPLDKKEFTRYTQKTIIGVSLITSVPTGLYLKDKLINTGSHRWAFKPEVGISKRFNSIYAEAYAGVWFYTRNHEYLTDKTLEQEPVFDVQAHVSYYFKNRMWISLNTTWFNGGQTSVNGVSKGNLLDNWRIGGTWSLPIAKGQSVKLQFHVGVFTTSGYDYDIVSLGYQHLF
jgi:hypothetical protein